MEVDADKKNRRNAALAARKRVLPNAWKVQGAGKEPTRLTVFAITLEYSGRRRLQLAATKIALAVRVCRLFWRTSAADLAVEELTQPVEPLVVEQSALFNFLRSHVFRRLDQLSQPTELFASLRCAALRAG
ncbi:hypothetical protein ASC96_29365 [Rhizobium sp. Root1204]|nr:hypothetical protein ASC96_29365 [Rhizobium sp. Root1204]